MNAARQGKVAFTVWLKPETLAECKRMAIKAEMSASRLISNIVEVNAEELVKLDKLGIFQFSVIMRELKTTLESFVRFGKEEPENFQEA